MALPGRGGLSGRSARSVAFAFALFGGVGCKGCPGDHPYVPYTIDDEPRTPPAASSGGTIGGPEDAGAFHARDAAAPPPAAARWTLEGLDLVAPADRTFVLGLTGDLDGDGIKDAVALVAPILPPFAGDPDAATFAPSELALYRGGVGGGLAPVQIIAVPPPLASGPGCAPVNRLMQVGPHSIALETGAACDEASAARWVASVVISTAEAKVHFRATLLDPPHAPALAVDIDGSDRDRDGIDDVAVRVSLEGGAPPFEPGPRVSATLRWFDRSAGMSRDPDEPDASFRALASVASIRAAKSKDAPAVPRYVEQVRSLYRALCAEGGSPRLVDLEGGRPLACGASKGLEEAGLAEVRAYAVAGDPLRAIAALDRAQLPPATRTAPRTADAQGWITQAAPVLAAPSMLRALGAVPQIERGPAPAWGALAFEASGKLLVRTVAGVVRADPVAGDEAVVDVAGGLAVWRSSVLSPDGASQWIDSYDACDGIALHATFARGSGGTGANGEGDRRDVALPVAPPLGARCTKGSVHGEPAPTLPVAWGGRGLEAIVGGEPLLVSPDLARATPSVASLGQPVTLGAPRSPNGKFTVVPTAMGVFVRGARARLFRAKELDGGYLDLRDCTVSDDGARVACVRGGLAFVGVWDPE